LLKKSTLHRKILVIGVIILFIGTTLVPNILGYNEKIKFQQIKKLAEVFPLNDNFVNAFWKFDECSGSIAEDSSGHNYDGTIYGATWTNDGYSGCALNFDGSDDYIDLDLYAKNFLGFNKTDDLIFSFYFKSSSTNKGVIYSMCRGDGYGYNPGFHIAINPNGTIQTQVWRLSCGIIFSSNNSYNDGEWHFAEIYYNGISANPIVDVFVDGELDASYQQYVCEFFSDNFRYAQMGRNSFEFTNYFDGALDEFKIIKYPGGNKQEPPEIDGPTHGEVGMGYEYTFTTYDPEGDDVYIKIDWGYGSLTNWLGPIESGEPLNVSHIWIYDGIYYIRAKSKDFWGESRWSDLYRVMIGDIPPFPPTISGQMYGNTCEELTYEFVAYDVQGQDLYYYVDWGDGNNTSWLGPYESNQTITRSHSWSENGTYEIRAKAKDINGHESDWSDPYHIQIGENGQYEEIDIDGPTRGRPGITYYYNFTIYNYDGESLTLEIDWGDGTSECVLYKPGQNTTFGHCWKKRGTYIIRARVKDEFGWYSGWGGHLMVIIPRVRYSKTSFLLNFLEHFRLLEVLLRIMKL